VGGKKVQETAESIVNKSDAKRSAGDCETAARLPHLVVFRLGDNVENLVDLGGLELTGTAERFRRSGDATP
jgi:hypothetical protein